MTSLTHHLTGTEAEEARKVYDPKTKLNGEVVKAKHVADAVLFLASQDSEVITGHDMVVDGGVLKASKVAIITGGGSSG
ncbi:hypothetical protein V6N13_013762 [Hibiscus sabdariffa]|uniref:Uncharacterized protein n=1 Tax=Hibiscus sabdariffa TaxID=183260 RepID=A0ABR2P2S3_9ROSI